MRKILLFIFLIPTLGIYSQEDSVHLKPFQVSLIYPLGTSGFYSGNSSYLFSFNILAGVTGAANGFELGGISNVNHYYNHGVQIAGISNVSGSYNKGFQIGGICNVIGGSTNGFQTGGICNLAGGSMQGVQLAGIMNACGDSATGVQLAGITNISGSFEGLQTSGIMNTANDVDGAQIAGITNIASGADALQLAGIGNMAADVKGAQIGGIFNVAGYVKGFQLAGIVNICDSIDGVPLALVSIVGKNGYRRWDIWGSEAFNINVSYKIGIRGLYTIFTLGYKPGDRDNNTGLGVGLGSNMMLGRRSGIDVEASFYHISRYLWMKEENFMYTLKMNYVLQLGRRTALFAGPVLNILETPPDSDAASIAPGYGVEFHRYNDWKYWLGFNAGIRF